MTPSSPSIPTHHQMSKQLKIRINRQSFEWSGNGRENTCSLLIKIGQGIPVLVHFADNFLHCVTDQHHEVKHEERPEHIYFYCLEHGAHDAQNEGECDPLPDLGLAHRRN